MSKKHPAKANRIYKDSEEDYRQKQIQAYGEFYTRKRWPTARPNNLNLCVYVHNAFTLTGILWWLHSKGYYVEVNMTNLYDPCTRNHFLTIAGGGYVNVGCVEHKSRKNMLDSEILEDIDDWINLVKNNEYYKDIINCGFNVDMFKELAEPKDNEPGFEEKVKKYRQNICNKY